MVCARKTSKNEDTFVWIPLEVRTLDYARIRSNRLESKVFYATRGNILVQRLIVFTWITGGILVPCVMSCSTRLVNISSRARVEF